MSSDLSDRRFPNGFTLRHKLKLPEHRISRLAWSPDGKRLAFPSYDGAIRLWDSETGNRLQIYEGHENIATGVAWSPDANKFASSSDDKTVRVWDIHTRK